ncbi:MAG TPA: L,D-transpeptidase [Actinomycetota bacterium]|nr:L,D-transpeptidase [Actinomycetota bacterium]
MRPRRLTVTVAIALAVLSACAPAPRPALRDELGAVVPAGRTRPHAPGDIQAARMLARGGMLVAMSRTESLAVHAAPGTERPYMSLDADNPWGQRIRLLVLADDADQEGDIWLRIQLPIWPNGQSGWVAATDVWVDRAAERVLVDLSDRRLVRIRGGDEVTELPVAIGAASTPTPPGRYYVWAKVDTDRPTGPYGSFILGLSGFSEAIEPWIEWPGQPRLAIHGTDDTADAGRAVSKGCVRVLNALLAHLRDVPMGTPVVIRQ